MKIIGELAQQHGIAIIEDNAQAHGAVHHGLKTGSMGHCNATSFYPTKNLGALGDGGVITTQNKTIYERALAFRNYGSVERFVNPQCGINSRLDELQAAVLLIKLKYLDEWNAKRKSIAEYYIATLAGVGDLLLPKMGTEENHAFHLFVVRTKHRNELQKFLTAKAIETSVHYPIPPHL